ncbi:MAG: YidB family protein [Steroidobacteraceae bacterium]
MGLFDGLLGGVVGAEMATVVNGLIERHGGVQGIVAQLEQQGLGGTVRSWVGSGTNQPISPAQVHQAFGADTINALAAKVGLNPQDLLQKLSQALPQAVDHMTPGGTVPTASS